MPNVMRASRRSWFVLVGASALGCGSGSRIVAEPVSEAGLFDAAAVPSRPDAAIGPVGEVDTPDTGSIVADDASLPPSCKPPFAFADPLIEAAVRASAKVPSGPLSRVDILSVTDLEATGATSLGGVECLVNLRTFGVARALACSNGLSSGAGRERPARAAATSSA